MEFVVKATEGRSARVFVEGKEVATIGPRGKAMFSVRSESFGDWKVELRDDGEIRPFSAEITCEGKSELALKIRNHLFFYKGAAYLLTGIPEEVRPADHVLGKRHVSRLDSFPFAGLDEVDRETWGRLRLHRGSSVGEVDGASPQEFRVTLSDELSEIGLPLSAALYLLYNSGQGARGW
ncbi:MAG: hypothetical protein JRN11_04270 [Nitrososphaerota archaeon]|nr:hypothetical protein [Nitrososphaerota archaeon]MDG7025941.1 hypothetical protein [Nitrososphaerota archaeon]